MSRKDSAIGAAADAHDWKLAERSLDDSGNAVLPGLLSAAQCEALAEAYADDTLYRSRIVMARHGFGSGEYKYYAYPLPDIVSQLRTSLYPRLAPIANRWNEAMGVADRFPASLQPFLDRCHEAGQTRPTPLILEYAEGDYNCLHQDLYGDNVFPLQVAILLARPGVDFTGGEFVMTEQGAKLRRAEVVPLNQGDAVVFAVDQRLTFAGRSARKVAMRHGVSKVLGGLRRTVGIIFHDAR